MAHSHNGNSGRGCGSDCDDDRPCDDDKIVREIHRDDGIKFCVEAQGDVDIEDHDSVVQVAADPDAAPGTIPTVTLPCPENLHCPHHVTILAVGTAVNVANSGQSGDQTSTIPAGSAATFWVSTDFDGCSFWVPDAAVAPFSGTGSVVRLAG